MHADIRSCFAQLPRESVVKNWETFIHEIANHRLLKLGGKFVIMVE
jgi:hypothetical protein